MSDCPFCKRIAAGEYDDRSRRFDAVTFEPLNPVTPGHRLVVPVSHVRSIANHPQISADVMAYAVMLASAGEWRMDEFNLITSVGAAATQTVLHCHLHLVPRWPDDGLELPWTGQDRRLRCQHCQCLLDENPECGGSWTTCGHVARGLRGCVIEPSLEEVADP